MRRPGRQEKEMPLEYEDLSEKIIGAAIKVHSELGPGFIESIYENALVIELRTRGLSVTQQQEVIIKYNGFEVGRHRLDLVVENTFVVELKVVKSIDDVHFAIVKSYLRATGCQHGLILNFSKVRLEAKRVIASS
jgi:GxxExxY protein